MRLLVLRENADDLIAALAARGHEGVSMPVEESRPLHSSPPAEPFEGFAITSAKAVGALAEAFPGDRRPLLAVGSASAETARKAGFPHVLEGPGHAAGMAALLPAAGLAAGATLLYAAGRVRTGTLEEALEGAGLRLAIWDVYETVPAPPDPLRVAAVADGGPCDGAMLLSRGQATGLARLLAEAPDLARSRFHPLCLSPRIAAVLPDALRKDAAISAEPTLSRLLELLDDPSFGL